MKILTIVLTFLCFHSFTAQAETVLDMSNTFQIASVKKVGAEGAAAYKGKLNNPAIRTGSATCARVQFQNSSGKCNSCGGNQCKPCPSHATCDGGSSFTCANGYYKKDFKCKPLYEAVECKAGYTKFVSGTNAHCYKDL